MADDGHNSSGDDGGMNDNDSQPPSNQPSVAGRWTDEEHDLFLQGLKLYGKEWKKIASLVAKQHGGGTMSTSTSSTSLAARSTRNRKRTALLQDDDDEDGEDEVDDGEDDSQSDRNQAGPDRIAPYERSMQGMSSTAMDESRPTIRNVTQFEGEGLPKRAKLSIGTFGRPQSNSNTIAGQDASTLGFQQQQQQQQGVGQKAFEAPRQLRKLNKPGFQGESAGSGDFGGITPRTVAAATILLRPRLQQKLDQGLETPKTRQTAEWLRRNEDTAARVLAQPDQLSWKSASNASHS